MWDKIAHNSESSVAELSGEVRAASYELDGCYCQQPVEEIQFCSKWTKSHHLTIWPCVSANINSFLVFCRAVIYHKATHRHSHHGVTDPSFGVYHWIATVDHCHWQQEHELRHQHLIKFPCLDAQQIFYHFSLSMVKVFQYISKQRSIICVSQKDSICST